MKKSKRCIYCRRLFHPNPRVKNQTYCSRKQCQRARKSLWQKHKMATDPDYRINQRESQKTWRENNPSYWRRYQRNNPKYCRRNRLLQIKRDQRHRITRLAKMDALTQEVVVIPRC